MNYYGSCRPVRQFYGQTDIFTGREKELRGVSYKMTAKDLSEQITLFLSRLPFAVRQLQFNLLDSHDVPRHARFALGDYVVTNGYSSIFPPGIMVGKILHVFNSSDGLSYRVQLRLSTDFGKLRHVCVIDNSALKDKALLLKAAQDSLKPRDTSKK